MKGPSALGAPVDLGPACSSCQTRVRDSRIHCSRAPGNLDRCRGAAGARGLKAGATAAGNPGRPLPGRQEDCGYTLYGQTGVVCARILIDVSQSRLRRGKGDDGDPGRETPGRPARGVFEGPKFYTCGTGMIGGRLRRACQGWAGRGVRRGRSKPVNWGLGSRVCDQQGGGRPRDTTTRQATRPLWRANANKTRTVRTPPLKDGP